jgi:hypothetical protein
MGDQQSSNDSVIDATSRTIVLAFDLVDKEIANMPLQLAEELRSRKVQEAIQSTLMSFALKQQKSGTSVISDAEAAKLANALLTNAGNAVKQDLMDQVKRTPEYKKLEASLDDLQKALKSSALGVWVDRNSGILYVVGAGLAIGGAAALYITKTGGPAVNFPVSQLTGKQIQVFKVGQFSLAAKLLAFQPETRTLGASFTATQSLERVLISLSIGVVATGADVKEVNGQLVLKTRDVNLGLSGSAQPSDRKVNLHLSIDVNSRGLPGPLNFALGASIKDGKATEGSLSGGMKTQYGTFGVTGSMGTNDRTGTEETKVLGTWSLNL